VGEQRWINGVGEQRWINGVDERRCENSGGGPPPLAER